MSLSEKLKAALESRRKREILRRLPSPDKADTSLVDFVSNDYLSLASHAPLRDLFLRKLSDEPQILGSGGSRLLVNGSAHQALEDRLAIFFGSPAALLFNSGYDANVSFFTCIPQEGDIVIYDEYIHASVHDGIRASRVRQSSIAFSHNSVQSLQKVLVTLIEASPGLKLGRNHVFIAVESLYSMDGTFAPLPKIIELLDHLLPAGNGHLIVDEAHATGLYGRQGRGLVSSWNLEEKVFARLHTFGKALASSGAVILTQPIVREYLVNYARPLIYTTSLSSANIIAIGCSFDMLEDGSATKLSKQLAELVSYALKMLRASLCTFPQTLLALPTHLLETTSEEFVSPIIPILTSRPRPLSSHLYELGLNARPISWPTVPKGKDRVRVCLHAGNTQSDVERLVNGIVQWAEAERNKEESINPPTPRL